MKLVLAGGSSHTNDYVARLRQRQSERVRILDWISGDALEEILTNAAVFVLPSDLEGLSLALLDAMGAGICVLASNTPENMEALGDAGFTFRKGDVDDLKRTLALLLFDSILRENTGFRAQARARAGSPRPGRPGNRAPPGMRPPAQAGGPGAYRCRAAPAGPRRPL